MKLIDILIEIINERKVQKNKWFRANDSDLKDYFDDMQFMINTTYSKIGGSPIKVNSVSDLKKLAQNWDLTDIDDDPDMDVTNGTKQKPAGLKHVMGASDGSDKGKKSLIKHLMKSLNKSGNYAELSGAPAHIVNKNGIPYIDDEDTVRKVLKKDDIVWKGDGWYERNIKGKVYKKRLFGNPKI